jgi:redox-sensing transcriptional repressor
LQRLQAQADKAFVYSHELAAEASVSAVQVRRDLMAIGYSGSPNRGYDTAELCRSIGDLLDSSSDGQGVALVGVGNLGRAIIAYVARQRPYLYVAAAFDNDPEKVGRVIHGCRTHPLTDLPQVVRELGLKVGIVAVPAANAQDAATRLIDAGASGILNFAPTPLRLPSHVYVENLDWTVSLEKAAYFARHADVVANR